MGETAASELVLTWSKEGHTARLEADLARQCFTIRAMDAEGRETFAFDSGQAG